MKKFAIVCVFCLYVPFISAAQDVPRLELFTGVSYLRGNLDANFKGFDVSAAVNANRWFGLAGDFSGHYFEGFKVHSFLFGPRFTYRNRSRVSPYANFLLGSVRLGDSRSDGVFGWALGGGVDVKLRHSIAIRALDATYLQLQKDTFRSKNGRLSTGIVWRFGGGEK
jgi:opacity protein-like surface antigen